MKIASTPPANSPEPWEDGLDAFWDVIVRRFPEATHGDLSPERTIQLDEAAEEAVKEWIGNNVPTRLPLCKTCGSEIEDSVNEGVFGNGECEHCERLRYETQPDLLKLAHTFLVTCEDRISLLKGDEDWRPDDEREDMIGHYTVLLDMCKTAIAKAEGTQE